MYIIISVIILLIIVCSVCLLFKMELPDLTGKYKVGRTSLYLSDNSRFDLLSDKKDQNRELMITVYYPAEPSPACKPARYTNRTVTKEIEKAVNIPGFIFGRLKSHSFENAPVSNIEAQYPVILFSSGMGLITQFFTAMLEELASQGYIVIAVSHPHVDMCVVYPDGRVARASKIGKARENFPLMLNERSKDIEFVINKLSEINNNNKILAGKFDLQNIGAVGHSLGGATSALAAMNDDRIKAAIDIDGTFYGEQINKGLKQPFMFIVSEKSAATFFLSSSNYKKLFDESKECYLCCLANSDHYSFVPDLFILSRFYRFFRLIVDFGKIPFYQAYKYTNKYITGFFDKYLKRLYVDIFEKDMTVEDEFMVLQKYEKRL